MNDTTSLRPRGNRGTSKPPPKLLQKAIGLAALAALQKTGREEVIRLRYPSSAGIQAAARWLERSASEIADSTSSGWAAELTSQVIAEFVSTASPFSAFLRLRGLGAAFEINNTGRIVIPTRLNITAPPCAAFVGEGGAIPVGMPKIGVGALDPVKTAAIAPLTEELLSSTNSQVEKVITNLLLEDLATVIDLFLTDDQPAIAGLRPAGLLHDVVLTPSVDAATDLGVLAAAMAAAKARTPALLLDPARLVSLWGDPVFGPQQVNGRLAGMILIPTDAMDNASALIAVDAAAFAGAIGEPEIVAGRNATLVMANADSTAPTHAVTPAGVVGPPNQVLPDGGILIAGGPSGAGTAGYHAMSMLQQYAVALRVVEPVAWTLIRTGAVAGISGADW